MIQAVGGSMLNPVAMSIITNTFTDPRERARAIGVWARCRHLHGRRPAGGRSARGVGRLALDLLGQPAVGLAALLLTLRFVPESRAPKARRPDPLGQLMVIVLFGSLTYAIIEAPNAGLGAVLPFAATALAALLGLLFHEPRRAEPLIDLRFFRSAPFSGATVIAVSAFAALGGFLFLSTLYLQNVRGLSALHAGLWMLPMAVPTFLCAPLAGRLVGSRGPRLPLLVAGGALTVSGVLFAAFEAETSNLTRSSATSSSASASASSTPPSPTPPSPACPARRPGGRRRRLHQPPAGTDAGRGGGRRGAGGGRRRLLVPRLLRLRRPARLVDPHRLRPGGPGAGHPPPAAGPAARPGATPSAWRPPRHAGRPGRPRKRPHASGRPGEAPRRGAGNCAPGPEPTLRREGARATPGSRSPPSASTSRPPPPPPAAPAAPPAPGRSPRDARPGEGPSGVQPKS